MLGEITQVAIGGVLLGGIYALAALGLSVIFGVSKVLNAAHGDFIILGGITTYFFFNLLEVNPLVFAVILIPVFLIGGFAFERVLIRPIADKPLDEMVRASILVTFGVSLAVSDLLAFTWGRDIIGVTYSMPSISIAEVSVSTLRLLALVVIVVVAVVLHGFFRKTYTGRAIRAVTEDREAALLIGTNISKMRLLSFGIGSVLAAIAGLFFVTIFTIDPYMGIPLMLKCLTIIILGGLGSLLGSLVGGLTIGFAESICSYYIGAHWSPATALFILILILLIKPTGLFGVRGAK